MRHGKRCQDNLHLSRWPEAAGPRGANDGDSANQTSLGFNPQPYHSVSASLNIGRPSWSGDYKSIRGTSPNG